MAFWSKKPDLEALMRVMAREGHTGSSRHNVEAASVLLSLDHWEALLAFVKPAVQNDVRRGSPR